MLRLNPLRFQPGNEVLSSTGESMSELLYQTDAYLKEFDAKITGVDPETRTIVLNQSAFYPGAKHQRNQDQGHRQTADRRERKNWAETQEHFHQLGWRGLVRED